MGIWAVNINTGVRDPGQVRSAFLTLLAWVLASPVSQAKTPNNQCLRSEEEEKESLDISFLFLWRGSLGKVGLL